MTSHPLQLEWLPGRYAVCRLEPTDVVPAWAQSQTGQSLNCITRTDGELSIVIDERVVPQHVKAERGFVALRLVGVIDFSLVGIFAKLTGALAAANVPVFVISTFDTDVLMVREQYRADAVKALTTVATFI